MTAEQRTLIEAKDLRAIELECHHCESRIRLGLRRLEAGPFREASHQCPNCKRALCNPPDVNRLADLIEALKELTTHTESTARIRFELATD